ncbi:hypothetical protein [Aliiruegeria sabulilitoris]|uniref:hypothetical protein n=1 Tax=Aliiruegeria sabulilitoris TaxID=1510458 RepID=UPI0012E3DD7F|nr:hypothetical protein [Aliiruegeria sabulilitoris]NDR58908.1 hypothetical protein [Pseudoruegeria sp. M32A2M]
MDLTDLEHGLEALGARDLATGLSNLNPAIHLANVLGNMTRNGANGPTVLGSRSATDCSISI